MATNHSNITLVTYSVLADGSSPTVCKGGRYLLDRLAERPEGAEIFEETSVSPTYATLMDFIWLHQGAIASFIITLWVMFAAFLFAAVLITILRQQKKCGGGNVQTVTKYYMSAFLFYNISLAVILLVLLYSLISIISTRDTMRMTLLDQVPDMYGTVFANLKSYVVETVSQMARLENYTVEALPVNKAKHALTSEFSEGFKQFVQDFAGEGRRITRYSISRECATDVRNLLSAMKPERKRLETFLAIGQRCADMQRQDESALEQLTKVVANATNAHRVSIAEALTVNDTPIAITEWYLTDSNETDDDGRITLKGIDTMQKKFDDHESTYGVYRFLSHDLMTVLLALMLLLLLSVALLVLSLVVGLSVHKPKTKPHKRTDLSHLIGHMFMATTCLFALYVATALPMAAILTAYCTLPECYLCAPVRTGQLYVLDDVIARLWPLTSRSSLFKRLVPSEVISKCTNSFVSILELSPLGAEKKALSEKDAFEATALAHGTIKIASLPKNRKYSQNAVFQQFLSALKTAGSTESDRNSSSSIELLIKKWSELNMRHRSNKYEREEDALRHLAPFYYRRYLSWIAEQSQLKEYIPQVIGPCYITANLLTAVTDVLCRGFTTELVGHWYAILIAILMSILVCPAALALSKFYYRARRKRGRKKMSRGRYRTTKRRSSLSGSGLYDSSSGRMSSSAAGPPYYTVSTQIPRFRAPLMRERGVGSDTVIPSWTNLSQNTALRMRGKRPYSGRRFTPPVSVRTDSGVPLEVISRTLITPLQQRRSPVGIQRSLHCPERPLLRISSSLLSTHENPTMLLSHRHRVTHHHHHHVNSHQYPSPTEMTVSCARQAPQHHHCLTPGRGLFQPDVPRKMVEVQTVEHDYSEAGFPRRVVSYVQVRTPPSYDVP